MKLLKNFMLLHFSFKTTTFEHDDDDTNKFHLNRVLTPVLTVSL